MAAGTIAARRRFDELADGGGSVAAQIVHDDDVAGPQGGNELLADIGAKAFAVDRAVEDAGRYEFRATQSAKKDHGAPMIVRDEAAQPFPLWTPAAQRRHIRLDPGLVDKDETGRIQAALPRLPPLTPPRDVGAALLKREQRFF
jgi:hypothetical protein